jgi:hypothetical protein
MGILEDLDLVRPEAKNRYCFATADNKTVVQHSREMIYQWSETIEQD